MKKLVLFIVFFSLISRFANAQQLETPVIKFKLKNTSLLPKKVTIISYQPGEELNGTESITILSRAEKELSFKVGTKVFLASSKQINTVMSGKKIDQEKPFLVVRKQDSGKVFTF